MLRSTAFAATLFGALVTLSGSARAGSAWISSGSLTPTEQRVAVSVGPARTTLWTSLRFDTTGGAMGIVVPAPPGASLDFSSDAWFEALEVATAPRIFPPAALDPFCPGKSGSASVFELDGQVHHAASLTPSDVRVLADVPAVSAWAAQAGLVIPSGLLTALTALSGVSFVAVRFNAPSGAGVTPTLRVAMSGAPPLLPLALTHAGGSDLRVSAWVIGQGEADLSGGVAVAISPSSLVWKAGAQASNYDDLRSTALASGPDTFLVESATHAALGQNVSIAQGTAFVDGVVTTFFERAAAYGDGAFDAASCISAAEPAVESSAVVAAVCPRAALGVVDPAQTCTESPAPGQLGPQILRCGPGADDLALALSGLTPALTWVTRQSLVIQAGSSGADSPLGIVAGAPVSPVLYAASVGTSDCGDAGTMSGSSSGTSSGASTGTSSGSMTSSGSTSFASAIGDVADLTTDVLDAVASAPDDANCSCSGPGATGDASSGDTTSSSDSCSSGGDSGSGDSCSSGSDSGSSDSCSGGDSGSSGSCSGDSGGGESCSGGGGDLNCATAGHRRTRAPKLSMMLMLAMAVAAPLRRRGRRSRARPRA